MPVPVWLGVPVCEGVHVGVMLPGARQMRTLSTSSSEGSLPSTALATRKVSSCWPGSMMVWFTNSQGDHMYPVS